MTGSIVAAPRGMRLPVITLVALLTLLLIPFSATAQSRDSLLNGTVAGAAVGAGLGIAFTYAVRDSDLTAAQYARSAVIFGALGAGAGAGLDALLSRTNLPVFTSRRLSLSPSVWRDRTAVALRWRW